VLAYKDSYKKYGIRKGSQLQTPPLTDYALFSFPRQSIYHYIGNGPLDVGPDPADFIFNKITHPVYVNHVTSIGDNRGTPRPVPGSPDSAIREYHSKNRRFKRLINFDTATKDELALIVNNYGLLPSFYLYPRTMYTRYNEWHNIQASLWEQVDELAGQSARQQYIFCNLPTVIPSLSSLSASAENVTQRTLELFPDNDSLFLLEVWKWIGEHRATSLLSKVKPENMNKVNLIFRESGKWFMLNLGMLNGWRVATKEELKLNPKANKKGVDAVTLSKGYLRLMMAMFQVRTGALDTAAAALKAKTSDNVPEENKPVVVGNPNSPAAIPVVVSTPHEEGGDDTADTIADSVMDTGDLEKELQELETISNRITSLNEEQKQQAIIETVPYSLEKGIQDKCDKMAENGNLSAAQYKHYLELAETYKKLPAPDGKGTLADFIKIDPAKIKMVESPSIKDINTVIDKTMLKSSLIDFDSRYISDVMQKDVANMVMAVQNAGLAVTSYDKERVEDVMGSFDVHTVRLSPVEGASSTVRFRLPVLEDDGTYVANGTKYRMRKQRSEIPIRKISPDQVALSSYYGKAFVSRSDKRVNNYMLWLRNQIMALGLDDAVHTVTGLYPADVFDNTFPAPRLYSSLSMYFRAFTVAHKADEKKMDIFHLNFDQSKRLLQYTKEILDMYEKDGMIVFGADDNKNNFLVMDKNDAIYIGDRFGSLKEYVSLPTMLGIDAEKAPIDVAVMRIMGKSIPIGVILGYEMGLEKLLRLLRVTPRRVEAGRRLNLTDMEYPLVFSDETLIFSKQDRVATMVLGGFNEYHKAIREYSAHEFDKPGVYTNILSEVGLGVRYLRELDLMYQMFIDPITRELLVEMKEPTDFRGLLMRSCELLQTDQHPDAFDSRYMRIKGYERMSGAVYSELVKSIRAHSGRVGKAKLPLDFNPHAVWKNISQDPSIALVSDINPIENLKQQEAVTFSGTGGRSSRSMTKHTRSYHPNDMGTISEATVDSSDVAINTFTSADPQFSSLRGLSKPYVIGETGPTALVSTSALLSPAADKDDPKRVNFISIQHTHGVACTGYSQNPLRTGYESVVGQRNSDLFSFAAKQDGKVISVTDTGLIVEYADGTTKGIEIGRRYGSAAGLTMPHTVVPRVKEGQSFKQGDILAYNSGFFEPDILNPANLVLKIATTVKTALMETPYTLEDSSAISLRTAKLLTTAQTKIKPIVVTFDQSIKKLVKPGDSVSSDDILCVIEDAITANNELFDQESLDTLRILGAQNTPLAKIKGVVERIEVYYHGDKEDMSESLRAIANSGDRELGKRKKSAGKKAFTGSVDEGFRIDGDPLPLDCAAIYIYITADVAAGEGDKGVFGNQLKTVFGKILTDDIKSESGVVIDAIFGWKSVDDRIVNSPKVIATTTTLLKVMSKNVAKAYRS
jgi:hypothetical protein